MNDVFQTRFDAFLKKIFKSITRKFIDTPVPAHWRITVTHDDSKCEMVVFLLIVRNTWQYLDNSINNSFLHLRKLAQKEFLNSLSVESNNARRIVCFAAHKNPI